MAPIRFRIAKENKTMFDSKFAKMFADEIANFSNYGEQPLMTWLDDEENIEINVDFYDKLPKTEFQQLIQSLQ